MVKLNLPPFEYKIQKRQNKLYIYDIIRKKYIFLTPEEWVRQHFIHYLINLGYPKSLIKVESNFKYNFLNKRSDICVYNKQGDLLILVECKSFYYPLNTLVLDQAIKYNSQLNSKIISISNGLQHFHWKKIIGAHDYNPIDHLSKFN